MALLKMIGVVALLLALCMLGLSVRILFHKSHRFVDTEVGHNPALRRRGITCPKHDAMQQWRTEQHNSGAARTCPADACATCVACHADQ